MPADSRESDILDRYINQAMTTNGHETTDPQKIELQDIRRELHDMSAVQRRIYIRSVLIAGEMARLNLEMESLRRQFRHK